jgi:beta-phosphoglucomutase-like phosphatase (HAD superfamily)
MAHDWIEPGKTLLDLLDVDVLAGRSNRAKPHPAIFLVACGELGVAPESCFFRRRGLPLRSAA